jgi:selenocysteine lyase/cysteine desulfurase
MKQTGIVGHNHLVSRTQGLRTVIFLTLIGPTLRGRLDAAFGQLHERGDALITQLWNGLEEIERVRLYGLSPGASRTPTIAFTVNDVPSIEVAKKLAERGIFLSHGDFYAMTVVERLGLAPDGLVRAGCACYTTTEEVDRLLTGVREL